MIGMCCFQLCASTGTVSVHLIEYHRTSTADCKGGGIFTHHNPCDLLFTICLNGLYPNVNETKSTKRQNCRNQLMTGPNLDYTEI